MRKLLVVMPLALALTGCGLKVSSVDQVAIDLTNAVCTPLENQPAGQPWVDFVCSVAQEVEAVIAQVSTSGSSTPLPAVRTVNVRVPVGEAPAFMAAHRKPS